MIERFQSWRRRRRWEKTRARLLGDIEILILSLDGNRHLREAFRKALRVKGSEDVEPTLKTKAARF